MQWTRRWIDHLQAFLRFAEESLSAAYQLVPSWLQYIGS